MPRFLDARVPVRFVPPEKAGADLAGPDWAWLAQDDAPTQAGAPVARFSLPPATAGHPAACACCGPRGPVADALARLFLARARGEVPFFRAVVAVVRDEAGAAAVMAALETDPLVQARFRLGD